MSIPVIDTLTPVNDDFPVVRTTNVQNNEGKTIDQLIAAVNSRFESKAEKEAFIELVAQVAGLPTISTVESKISDAISVITDDAPDAVNTLKKLADRKADASTVATISDLVTSLQSGKADASTVQNELALKASLATVNAALALKQDAGTYANGIVYKGTKATLAEIQAITPTIADSAPTHQYYCEADSHYYTWNGTTWDDTGTMNSAASEVEQARGSADSLKDKIGGLSNIGAMKTNEFDMKFNVNIQKMKYIPSFSYTTYKPDIANDTSVDESTQRFVIDFKIPENIKSVKIKFPTGTISNQFMILYNEVDKIFNRTFSQVSGGFSGNGISYTSGNDYYTLYLKSIRNLGYTKIALVGLMQDLNSMYMKCTDVEFNWLKPAGFDTLTTNVNQLLTDVDKNKNIGVINTSDFDIFKSDLVTIQEKKYIPNVDTTTHEANIQADGSNTRFVATFNVPTNIKKAKVKFPTGTISNQMFVLTTTTSFINYTYSTISAGYNGNGISYTAGNDYFEMNFNAMRSYNITKVSFVGLMSDLPNEYMRCSDVKLDWISTPEVAGSLDNVDIVMPPRIYGVVGMETNIYFDNLLYGSRLNNVAKVLVTQPDAAYADSQTYEANNRIVWNPTSAGTVSKHAKLYRYTTDSVSVDKTFSYVATAANAGNGRTKKVLCIGDSKIDNGILTPFLYQDGVDDSSLSITCVGTRGPENGKHEGRAGWKASDYCGVASRGSVSNPFYNNNTFDFSYYMTNSGISTPDYVFINLGTNDCGSYEADTFITHLNTMIASIKTYNSSIIICIGLCEGSCTAATDGNYDLNDKIQAYHIALITEFSDREDEKIFLCPLYVSIDLANDYNTTAVPLSKRDGTVNSGKTMQKVSDHLHQNNVGYYKNADMMYSLIKYIENLIDNNML